jgi:hypothetical protein
VNTRTPKIDALRIWRTGVPGGGQHHSEETLATADLVRDGTASAFAAIVDKSITNWSQPF